MAWFHLVMSAITDTVLPLPLHFFLGFTGPGILVIGSALVMAMWHSRLGTILVLAACALFDLDDRAGLHFGLYSPDATARAPAIIPCARDFIVFRTPD